MPERRPQFADLERLLWQAGVIDSCSRRLIDELADHLCDLVADECARGTCPSQAWDRALIALGRPADIAAAAAQQRELLAFRYRHPVLANITRGIANAAAIPGMSVDYCARRSESIARWGASVGLAGMLTAALLLSMQTVLGTF